MKNFVKIETVFSSEKERTIEGLSSVYNNKSILRSVVDSLMSSCITEQDIKGKSVLIKPNWVRQEIKESDYICLRTNDSLLLIVLEEVLKKRPIKVLIADAPVQGCKWNLMITNAFLDEVDSLSKAFSIPVLIKDFRRTVSDLNNNRVSRDLHPMSDYVLFDLGEESYLEPITTTKNNFRVTNYNPDRMAEVHHKGMHKYCVAKDVFDYDTIITIPKLKTHRMAGMTNSLKLLVGINGDKDYLPHHRIGSAKEGGDNYKNKSLLRTVSNYVTDTANRHLGSALGHFLTRAGSALWKLSKPDRATMVNAGWYGNDTIWRTVMDLNTIALYGDSKGHIHKKQQRRLVTIMDGIIGGQGDGPLHPDPSPLGVLAISDNPYLMDVVASQLYHIDYNLVPLLKEAKRIIDGTDYSITLNDNTITLEDVTRYGIDIKMSPGWEGYKETANKE